MLRPTYYSWGLLGLALSGGNVFGATMIPTPVHTVDLEYRESSEELVTRRLEVISRFNPFPKEPMLLGKDIQRGSLAWGKTSDQFIPYIWDCKEGRLYLDLNRNGDLTDDTHGVFRAVTNTSFQTFSNVHLVRESPEQSFPCRVTLQFWSLNRNPALVYISQCWLWQGKLVVQGKEWQLGMIDNAIESNSSRLAPRWLLLRPWTERDRLLNLRTSTPDLTDYVTNLFFGGQAYQLNGRWETTGTTLKYQVTLQEQASQLGELQVSGRHLHRLILANENQLTAILDQPKGTFKLPVGNYTLDEIWLRDGEAEAACFKGGNLTIEKTKPACLIVGGPLTNSTRIKSSGNSLHVTYTILGADGRSYRMIRGGETNPPTVAIFHGTNQLAADKFRYG